MTNTPVKGLKDSFKQKTILNPYFLFSIYLLVNLVPTFYFLVYQPVDFIGKLLILFFPLGLFGLILSLSRNTAKWQIFLFPILVIHAFQIVLFFIYGKNDPITADMYLNVMTTNGPEIDELLSAIIYGIVFVVLLYIPTLILAIIQWSKRIKVSKIFNRTVIIGSLGFLLISFGLLPFAQKNNAAQMHFLQGVYPANDLYNLVLAWKKQVKINRYPETSKGFSFMAHSEDSTSKRKIIVLVVGETGRAVSWQLLGYDRPTNPNLAKDSNLVVFPNALTQSDVTHKSVPIILSSNDASNFDQIYKRKGVFTAFKEAGYTTVCLSNQAENGSFIEYFYHEADHYQTLRKKDPKTGILANHPDGDLIPLLKEAINKYPGNLFIVLHTYGSHFNYTDRYPKDFAHFQPDNLEGIKESQREKLVNAYDNTIRYTDFVLSKFIEELNSTDAISLLLYSSDHGEDIFDDDRAKFLHASPTPTYYQLRIPFLVWLSTPYKEAHPEEDGILRKNSKKGVSTNSIFSTLMQAGKISTPYYQKTKSLLSNDFRDTNRLYLNDYDRPTPVFKLNLAPEDFEEFKKVGINK